MEKSELFKILAREFPLSNAKRTLTNGVMDKFRKILNGRNKELKDKAVAAYNDAKAHNKKLNNFNMSAIKKAIKQSKIVIEPEEAKIAIEPEEPAVASKDGKHYISHPLHTSRDNAKKDFLTELWEEAMMHHIRDLERYIPDVYPLIKATLSIEVLFDKYAPMFDDEEEEDVKEDKQHLIIMEAQMVSSQNEINEIKKNYMTMCYNALEGLKQHGSNWSIKRGVRASTAFFRLTKNRKGSSYIKSVTWKKQGLINIQNDDNECFKWCVLYHQTPKANHCERLSVLRKVQNKYSFEGLTYPV